MIGFCLGGIAMAQEPTKLAEKKAGIALKAITPGIDAAKVKFKEARVKELESGRAIKVSASKPSKAALAVEKAN